MHQAHMVDIHTRELHRPTILRLHNSKGLVSAQETTLRKECLSQQSMTRLELVSVNKAIFLSEHSNLFFSFFRKSYLSEN